MKSLNTSTYILHSKGYSPIMKGLVSCLKPINEHDKNLWRVLGETNIRHKPDLNADLDGTMSTGLIFEELERGGPFKEYIRHPLGWSNSYRIDRESFIVPYIPLNHAGKENLLNQSALQSTFSSEPSRNPFTGEIYAQSPSATVESKSNLPITNVQYLRLRITATRNGCAPQLGQIHFFYNNLEFYPRSAISNYPTKSPHNYHYCANLLKNDDRKNGMQQNIILEV